ncbi:MAG: hypothetical protein KDC38_07475, partial [Planctomycetes bacterium]|nr:hypothetical protein [Planctomycetota bacterium]
TDGASRRRPTAVRAATGLLLLIVGVAIWLLLTPDDRSSAIERAEHRDSMARRLDESPTRSLDSTVSIAPAPSTVVQPARLDPPPYLDRVRVLRVVDARTGSPVEGATVATRRRTADSARRSVGRRAADFLMLPFADDTWGRTDADGRLSMPAEVITTQANSVRHPEYAEWRETAWWRTDLLDVDSVCAVELVRASTATIQVLDSRGSPLPGARVRLEGSSGDRATMRTDDRGRVSYARRDYDYRVTVEAEGHVPRTGLAQAPEHLCELVAGAASEGVVLDAHGVPVGPVVVALRCPGHFEAPISVRTDARGHFVTVPLPSAGQVDVAIELPEFPVYRSSVVLPCTNWTLVLEEPHWVEGVVRPSSFDLDGSTVFLVPREGPFLVRDLRTAQPSSDGTFRVGPVGAGQWIVTLCHPWGISDDVPVSLTETTLVEQVSFELRESAVVEGIAVLPTGDPAVGVEIRIGSVFGDEVRGPIVHTDASGWFSVHGLPQTSPIARPGTDDIRWAGLGDGDRGLILEVAPPHQLVAKNQVEIPTAPLRGSRNSCRVDPGERDVRLTIAIPERVRPQTFELHDDLGRPVRTVTNLIVASPRAPRSSVIFAGTHGVPALNGDSLDWSDCIVGIWTREYAITFVRVSGAGTQAVPMERRLDRSLRVVDASGAPVTALPVFVEPIVGPEPTEVALFVGRTDADGRILVPLGAGTYRVRTTDEADRADVTLRPFRSTVRVEESEDLGSLRWEPRQNEEQRVVWTR